MSTAFSFLSKSDQEKIGHNLKDMLIDCSFAGTSCTVDDFYWFYDIRYGNCYSFNHRIYNNGSAQTSRTVFREGFNAGLTLTLDVQSEMYLPFTKETGIIMSIQKAGIYPYLSEQGFVAGPGLFHGIGMRQEDIVLPGPPHSYCKSDGEDGDPELNWFSHLGYKYSLQTCRQSVQQSRTLSVCGCCNGNIPCNPSGYTSAFGVDLPMTGNEKVCNISIHRTIGCVVSVANSVDTYEAFTQYCLPGCTFLNYRTRPSVAQWPNKQRVKEIFNKINGSSRIGTSHPNISVDAMYSLVKDNVVVVDVHFNNRMKESMIVQPTYSWNTLLSNVGGQLGLWLGFSLLTGFEVAILVFDLMAECMKRISLSGLVKSVTMRVSDLKG